MVAITSDDQSRGCVERVCCLDWDELMFNKLLS